MDKDQSLLELRRRTDELTSDSSNLPATKADVCALASIISELIVLLRKELESSSAGVNVTAPPGGTSSKEAASLSSAVVPREEEPV